MRLVLLLLALVGCMNDNTGGDPFPPPGGGSGGGPGSVGCESDSQCGTLVCARDGECLAASNIYIVHVTWTLMSQPANATTCASSPDLELFFQSSTASNWWGYSPVPCVEGKFTVDKMPVWFDQVQLGLDQTNNNGVWGRIDRATGIATIDLPF
jgi:hypothetical protein